MFGIDLAFWIGMGVIAVVVIVGCSVAWLIPPKKDAKTDTAGA